MGNHKHPLELHQGTVTELGLDMHHTNRSMPEVFFIRGGKILMGNLKIIIQKCSSVTLKFKIRFRDPTHAKTTAAQAVQSNIQSEKIGNLVFKVLKILFFTLSSKVK